jgi:hypothetical protein
VPGKAIVGKYIKSAFVKTKTELAIGIKFWLIFGRPVLNKVIFLLLLHTLSGPMPPERRTTIPTTTHPLHRTLF